MLLSQMLKTKPLGHWIEEVYIRFTLVENTFSNSPKSLRVKFLGSDGLFCFISIFKFRSFKSTFAMVTSLCELYFRIRRYILLVQMKKVISMHSGSSTSSWKPWIWVKLEVNITMRDIHINVNMNPLTKFTSSSRTTEFNYIVKWIYSLKRPSQSAQE